MWRGCGIFLVVTGIGGLGASPAFADDTSEAKPDATKAMPEATPETEDSKEQKAGVRAEVDDGETGLSTNTIAKLIQKGGGFQLRLWAGAAAGALPQVNLGVGGLPQVGISGRILWGFVEPEMVVGYGGYAGYGHSQLRLSIGSKFILNLDVAKPFLWVGYSHIHETLFADILRDPVGTTLTTAESVSHRSGIEVGFGLLMPVDVPVFGSSFRVEAYSRAVVMVLPQLSRIPGLTDEKIAVPHDGYLMIELGMGIPILG